MLFFLVIGILLGALSVVFALQNVIPVTISFFTWHLSGSLSVILLASVLAGVLICTFFTIPEVVATHFRFRRLTKENKKTEDELAHHKAMLNEANAKLADQAVQLGNSTVTTTQTVTEQVI